LYPPSHANHEPPCALVESLVTIGSELPDCCTQAPAPPSKSGLVITLVPPPLVLAVGGTHTCPVSVSGGTLATQRLLPGSTAWALEDAVPTQNVEPPTFEASTPFNALTACACVEVTLLT
jgi:hypothetical protein